MDRGGRDKQGGLVLHGQQGGLEFTPKGLVGSPGGAGTLTWIKGEGEGDVLTTAVNCPVADQLPTRIAIQRSHPSTWTPLTSTSPPPALAVGRQLLRPPQPLRHRLHRPQPALPGAVAGVPFCLPNQKGQCDGGGTSHSEPGWRCGSLQQIVFFYTRAIKQASPSPCPTLQPPPNPSGKYLCGCQRIPSL